MRSLAGLAAIAALLSGVQAPSLVGAQYTSCNHNTWWGSNEYISGHLRQSPASPEFAGGQISSYDRAWRGWWAPDTSNPAVWADWTVMGTCVYWTEDGVNCLRRLFDGSLSGQEHSYHPVGFSSRIIETDMHISTANPLAATACSVPIFTEEATYIHELGHSYGYGHFDDWLSTMNTNMWDVTSCEPRGTTIRARPSSEAMRCHKVTYGLPGAYDVGATPLRKTCPLATGGPACASVFVANSMISRTSTNTFGYVEYTAMNLRDALPDYVAITIYASTDNRFSAGDNVAATGLQWNDPLEGETRILTHGFFFNPTVVMPSVGVQYCFLVRLNSDGYFTEFNPDDDVIDTQVCYTRI